MIADLNKDFESRIRLGIMSILLLRDWVDFTEMKKLLHVTDGNLASHIASLEKKKYIEIKKEFIDKKPKTSFRITQFGRTEFGNHINALEKLLEH